MKQVLFVLLLVNCVLLHAQDTLLSSLPAGMYRSFILYEDSTFRFESKLQMYDGYAKGTYSKKGDDYHFFFDKTLRDDEVEQNQSNDPDSLYFYCNARTEIFVVSDTTQYRGYNRLAIPYTNDTILFQTAEDAIYLWNHKNGNTYHIVTNPKGGKRRASTNISFVILTEYRKNYLKIKQYDILFAAKVRQVGHRMKDRDFVRQLHD